MNKSFSGLAALCVACSAAHAATPPSVGSLTPSALPNVPVLAAGAAVARPLADKLGDTLSLADFGAKCDGTTDDSDAVSAALASGRPVLVPGNLICAAPGVAGAALSASTLYGGGAVLGAAGVSYPTPTLFSVAQLARSAGAGGSGGTTYTAIGPVVVNGGTIGLAFPAGVAAPAALSKVAATGDYLDLLDIPVFSATAPLALSGAQVSAIFPTGVTAPASFSKVAATGAYGDLSGLPVIPAPGLLPGNNLADVASAAAARSNLGLAAVAASGSYADLANKPVIPPAYTLPAATPTTLGGVIASARLSVAGDGTLDLAQQGASSGQALVWNGSSWAPSTVSTGASSYTLPAATPSTLGGVTVSTGLSVSTGALSVAYGTAAGTAAQGNDPRFAAAEQAVNKGAAGGYAPLTAGGLVPVVNSQPVTALGGYVDPTNASNIASGTLAAARLPALTTSSVTEGGNLYFTTARAAAAAPVQSVAGLTGAPTVAQIAAALGGQTGATLAFGSDPRLLGALQAANSLSDLGNPSAARANLGLGSAATSAAAAFLPAAAFPAATASQLIGGSATPGIASAVTVGPGLSLSGGTLATTDVASFNSRSGAVTLSSADVATALGFTPYSAANPAGYIAASGAPVQSVAGRTGAVALGVGDVAGAAPLASPALTGTPTVPTAGAGTNTTQAASTAFATGAVAMETTRALAAEAGAALKANNLSDLASASAARGNLGLGTAATQPAAAFDPAGAATAAAVATSPALAPYMHAPNAAIWQFGDSRVAIDSFDSTTTSPQNFAKLPQSVVGWAQRFSGDALTWDVSSGYGGASQVAFKVAVTNGGTGYSASSTCSSTGGGTYGSPTVGAGGTITSIPLLTGGSGLTAAPIVTCSGGTGLNAVAVIGGSGTFGDPGETSCQAETRLPDLEAKAVAGDQVLVEVGTNDELGGLSLAQSEACMKADLDRLLADGYYVIYGMDGPRLPWGAASDATAPAPQYRKQMYARRQWVKRYALQDAAKNTAGYPHLFLLDTFPEVVDTTSAYGDPKPGYTQDGLHYSQLGAYIAGWKLAQIENALLPAPAGVLGNVSQADVFDATYNPGGALNPNPGLTGTTGTLPASAGGQTISGTLPANYTLSSNGTTGTQTVTAGLESTRTDGLNGARPQIVVACGAAGSATQTYTLAMTSYVQLAAAGLTNGEKIRLDIDVEVSGQAGMVLTPAASFNVNDTGGALLFSTDGATSASGQVAIENAGVNDGLVPPLGAGMTLHLSTPAFTLTNIGTTAGTQVQVKGSLTWGQNCSGAAGSSGSTVKVTKFSLHPVV